MRTEAEIDALMEMIPLNWRARWCGGENGACACMGCVQIGNRIPMATEFIGQPYNGDPEYIDESRIPNSIYNKYKITKDEWDNWTSRQEQPA